MSLAVLVVEDEPKVRRFVAKALLQAGMQVETLADTEELEAYLSGGSFDVLVLDRLLGTNDSLPLIPRLKRAAPRTKVLVLSALGEADERVSGLEMGADDYLPKPFHVAELVARVRSLGRRTAETAEDSNRLRFEDLEIRLDTQEVSRGGKPVPLTAKEFRLLTLLAQRPNRVFSRSELLDRVWGVNADPGSNVVDVTVNRLRTKIETGAGDLLIHTRRGSGYWFGRKNEID